jgi:hypothetical protein
MTCMYRTEDGNLKELAMLMSGRCKEGIHKSILSIGVSQDLGRMS